MQIDKTHADGEQLHQFDKAEFKDTAEQRSNINILKLNKSSIKKCIAKTNITAKYRKGNQIQKH